MKEIGLTAARKAEILRAHKAAQEMYACAIHMLELAMKCATDYNLTEADMREVILSPILIFISNRNDLTIQEKRALMKLMINQACDMYEDIIGSLFDEEDYE